MSEGLSYKKALIDEELKPLIEWLNENDYKTVGCCYGHYPDFEGYIKFDKKVESENLKKLFSEFNKDLEYTYNYFVYDKKKHSVLFISKPPVYGKKLEEYIKEWTCRKF